MNSSNLHFKIIIAISLLVTVQLSTLAADLPPGFAEVLVAQELDPTGMALTPDGRLFITEKIGRIRIIENGQLLEDPFLILEVDNYNERGLSGIAFDPHFELNGYLYLYYTVKGENHNRVSRFTANGNYVVPGSETILLDIDELNGTVHNAGSMAFGIDEKLYISVGDGANAQAAQSLNSLRGKILRINPDGTIPEDNPFFNVTTGIYGAIYALGFRNSFSMTIQPGTGRIFATEVGAADWEEVNEILSGFNYGWPLIEGPLNGQTPPANYKDPVYFYNHTAGCAAVGAAFYNPEASMFPAAYAGKFFFADYCRGYIRYMDPNVPGVTTPFATNINRPLNLLVAPDGTMYYLARAGIGGGSEEDNTASNNGTLWRIFYTGSGAPFISVNPQSLLVSEGEDARFFISASGEEPLTYQWQLNSSDIPGATASEYTFTNTMVSDSGSLFRCIVSNGFGNDTSIVGELRVTLNKRPVPEIITPIVGSPYRAGDTIFFSGKALDFEQGELTSASLRWKIDFHHNVHTHPALVPTDGISEGQYLIPQTGETADDVWYRLYLTATDSAGLSKTVSQDILPVKTLFKVETVPNGLPVYIDNNLQQSPITATSVVGIIRHIEVVGSIFAGDSIRLFTQWSDGETLSARTITAEDDTVTYTALYETYPLGNGIGILGYYYDGLPFDPTFYEPYAFTRIDTTINFDWEQGSPATKQLGNDFWLVRWDGFIQPLFDDDYTFHVIGDDGVRLWINDQLILDGWVAQAPTEWTGNIALEAGFQYPLRLEYFEESGGAVCKLLWSSDRIAKSIVPKFQLFPASSTSIDYGSEKGINVSLYPNPANEFLLLEFPDQLSGVKEIQIQNALGQVILQQDHKGQTTKMEFDIRHLASGMYWLKYITSNGDIGMKGFLKF